MAERSSTRKGKLAGFLVALVENTLYADGTLKVDASGDYIFQDWMQDWADEFDEVFLPAFIHSSFGKDAISDFWEADSEWQDWWAETSPANKLIMLAEMAKMADIPSDFDWNVAFDQWSSLIAEL